MDKLTVVILLAILAEAIWETLKMTWQKGKISIDRVGALVISIGICVAAGVDMFSLVGVPLASNIIGMVATGVLISRGANFIHDLIDKFAVKG